MCFVVRQQESPASAARDSHRVGSAMTAHNSCAAADFAVNAQMCRTTSMIAEG
jgi:hypothetical protein